MKDSFTAQRGFPTEALEEPVYVLDDCGLSLPAKTSRRSDFFFSWFAWIILNLAFHQQVMKLLFTLRGLALTWQGFGPLDSGDDLVAPESVQRGHEARGGVGDGAVIARVHDLGLDGL